MNTRKRLAAFFLAFAMVLTFLPSIKVQADTISDIDIISNTQVTASQAKSWAKSKGATDTFISLADLYWKYASKCGNVNPGIAYVQAAKETGYGKFGGVIDESYHNPCGMKTSSGGGDYDPNAHQKFNSWDEGVQAHLDHLALYAGAAGYPKSGTYDPRHFATIKGKAPTVNSLGTKWAPSSTYGEEVNKLYNDLLKSAGIVNDTDSDSDKDDSSENNGSNNNSGSNSGSNNGSTIITKPEDTAAPSGPAVTEPIKPPTGSEINISSSIGWKYQGSNWYYYKSDGSKATGWINPNNYWYYMYSNGQMAKGWVQTGGKWYYFKSSGEMQLGWIKLNGTWYYLQGDGSMVTGFKLINGKTYFFDTSGAMRTGWFKISNQWYYFSVNNGDMLTGWIKPYNTWYYLHSNGIMATGWLAKGGEWYYLYSSGEMATGWINSGGKYYYMYPSSGKMATATVIDGWEIGPDGIRGNKVSGSTSKLIVIDPGHNFGGDDGAYATHNGITYSERDLNMQVALKLKTKLEAKGYRIVLTRKESDREYLAVTQSLTNRVKLANDLNADFFISLHHNSAASTSANGVETYYSDRTQDSSFGGAYSSSKVSTSRTLATAINNAIASNTGAYNRGAKEASLFVCRNTSMPSVLVELGFISNPTEVANCASSSYQNLSTEAIANAIANKL